MGGGGPLPGRGGRSGRSGHRHRWLDLPAPGCDGAAAPHAHRRVRRPCLWFGGRGVLGRCRQAVGQIRPIGAFPCRHADGCPGHPSLACHHRPGSGSRVASLPDGVAMSLAVARRSCRVFRRADTRRSIFQTCTAVTRRTRVSRKSVVARTLHLQMVPVWSEAAPPAPLRGHSFLSIRHGRMIWSPAPGSQTATSSPSKRATKRRWSSQRPRGCSRRPVAISNT